MDGSYDAQFAALIRYVRERLASVCDQLGVDVGAAPMLGHVREPDVHITTVVDKWEGDLLFPLKEACFYHGFQRRIRHSQRAHTIRVIDATETGTFLGTTDLKRWLLLRRAYIQEEASGAQGGMDRL